MIQLKRSLLVIVLRYTTTTLSQVNWVYDFEQAKAITIEKHYLQKSKRLKTLIG